MILEVRGLRMAYGAFEVVHQVDMAVAERQIVGLFGHNGAGKSSLLKGIYGVLPVRAGKVCFTGEDTTNQQPFRQAMRGMRFVPQESNVFPKLTVEDNLRMGALRLTGDKAVIAERFKDVYEIFPILSERRAVRAHVLSGGERQMLAVSIALMTRPKLLLLDEPSAGLAPILVTRVFETIRMIRDRFGVSVVLVEQNVNEALRIIDEVCVLQEGHLVFTGRPSEKDQIVRHLWRLDLSSSAQSAHSINI
jgi:branched-chain amino acid transport system ATP-binding protein